MIAHLTRVAPRGALHFQARTTRKEDPVPGQVREARQDLEGPWREIQRELAALVLQDTYRIWFSPLTPVARRGATLYLTGPHREVRWVGRRYMEYFRIAIDRAGGEIREIELITPEDAAAASPAAKEAASRVALNPSYTFERFVIGPGNQLAHAAALAVAEAPGEAYNPLFLHGPPGLGKTHLLGAIANYLHRHAPQLSAHYTTAESFTNEFVSSLQGAGIDAFKERYRRADVLLIDDVQFLEGKARTADEFFHTFNALYEGGAQLVLTADRVPGELSGLVDRLRDRFEWGLTVPVDPPDLATRLVFLGNLAREQTEELPPDALRALASKTSPNLRVLQGALTRVVAHSSLSASAITADSVERALPAGELAPTAVGPARCPTDPGGGRRAPRSHRRGHPLPHPHGADRAGSPARHVPDPRSHRPLAARHRRGLQPPGSHHRSARHPQGRARRTRGCQPLACRRGAQLRAPLRPGDGS